MVDNEEEAQPITMRINNKDKKIMNTEHKYVCLNCFTIKKHSDSFL